MARAQPPALDVGLEVVGPDLGERDLDVGVDVARAQPEIDAARSDDRHVVGQRRRRVSRRPCRRRADASRTPEQPPTTPPAPDREWSASAAPRDRAIGVEALGQRSAAGERAARTEVPRGLSQPRRRPLFEAELEARRGEPRRRRAGAVLHEHAHPRLGLEHRAFASLAGDELEAIRRQRRHRSAGPEDLLVDCARERREAIEIGLPIGDVDVEEGDPVPQDPRARAGSSGRRSSA